MTNKKWCLALVLLTCSVLLSEDYANSVSPDKRHIRCGTSLFQHNLKNKETGSYFSREVIVRSARHAASLRYSVSKKSGATPLRYLSPSGKFPIYYNFPADSAVPDSDAVTLTPSGTWTNSPNGIPDYIEWVAQAADTSYWLMRDTLGYEDSSDSIMIQMVSMPQDGNNYYGYIDPGDDRNIKLHYSLAFLKPYRRDIRDGYRVTLAHELYHVIQFHYTNGVSWGNFFFEPSAVWMENKIYPAIKDYLQYAFEREGFIRKPNQQLDIFSQMNYDKFVWPMYLDEKYGHEVNRGVWEAYRSGKTSFSEVFSTSNIDTMLADFGIWLFNTGSRATYSPRFKDAALWPSTPLTTIRTGEDTYLDTTVAPRGFIFLERDNPREKLRVEPSYSSEPAAFNLLRRISPSSTATTLFLPRIRTMLTDTISKYVVVSNSYLADKNFILDGRGRFYSFKPGQYTEKIISASLTARMTFHKSIICTLENENGDPNSSGFDYLGKLQKAGIDTVRDTQNVSLLYPTVLKVSTIPEIEKLIDSSAVSIQLISETNRGAAYKIDALDTNFSPIATSSRISGDICAINYSEFRELSPPDTSGQRIFLIAERWIKNKVRSPVFPLPAKLSDGEIFVSTSSANENSELLIYSLSGKLVKRIPASCSGCSYNTGTGVDYQKIFRWNLRNSENSPVSPGVYLYSIRNYTGNSDNSTMVGRGKIAIVTK